MFVQIAVFLGKGGFYQNKKCVKMLIRFYEADKMRYDDVGDYFTYKNTLYIVSYKFKKPYLKYYVFVHEFVEFFLLKTKGISFRIIDEIDTERRGDIKAEKEYDFAHSVALRAEKLLSLFFSHSYMKIQKEILSARPEVLNDLSIQKYVKYLKKKGKLIFELKWIER